MESIQSRWFNGFQYCKKRILFINRLIHFKLFIKILNVIIEKISMDNNLRRSFKFGMGDWVFSQIRFSDFEPLKLANET